MWPSAGVAGVMRYHLCIRQTPLRRAGVQRGLGACAASLEASRRCASRSLLIQFSSIRLTNIYSAPAATCRAPGQALREAPLRRCPASPAPPAALFLLPRFLRPTLSSHPRLPSCLLCPLEAQPLSSHTQPHTGASDGGGGRRNRLPQRPRDWWPCCDVPGKGHPGRETTWSRHTEGSWGVSRRLEHAGPREQQQPQ